MATSMYLDMKTKFMVQYYIKTKDDVFKRFKLFYQEYILYLKSRHHYIIFYILYYILI